MSEDEYGQGSGLTGSPLAPQLGTDTVDLAKGRFDMERLSIIPPDKVRFLLYAKLMAEDSDVWKTMYDTYLNLMVSVYGRGRRDIIRMESVSKGGPAEVESEIIRPGWIARNTYDKGWKEKQELEKGG